MATSLYHPDTVERSFATTDRARARAQGPDGKWDLRPHRRPHSSTLTTRRLATWHAVLEDAETPVRHTRMVYAVNRATAAVLDKLVDEPSARSLGLQFSQGWNESIDRKKGYFDSEWGRPESGRRHPQGPHLSWRRRSTRRRIEQCCTIRTGRRST